MLGDRINDRKRISLAFLGAAHTMDLLSLNTGRQPHIDSSCLHSQTRQTTLCLLTVCAWMCP